MADHRSRIGAAPAGSTAAFLLVLLCVGLALLAARPAPAFDFGGDAQARSLGDEFARLALDTPESNFLLQSGQISQRTYRERLQRDQAALPRLQQALARLSSAQQAAARQQAATRFNQGMADLHRQVTDWQQRGRPRGPQRAGRPAAQTYTAPPPYVPPAPYTPPQQPSRFERLLLLLLAGAGVGAGVVVIARRRRTGSPALPPDAEEIPSRATATATSAAPALPEDAGMLPTMPASGPVMPRAATASSTPVTGDAKERLLAEQTAKYQATLTAAMDELTATQVALEERKTVPELIDKDLARVGGLVYERLKKLLREQASGMGKMVLHALVLLPLWHRFRRGGIGFKILVLFGAYWLYGVIGQLMAAGFTHSPIVIYLIIAGLCFYFARRAQTRGTVRELEANATSLQHPSLLRIYAEQAPGPLWLLRFWSAPGKPPCDEAQVALPNVDATAAAAGGTLLSFGDLATYRIATDADPVFSGGNAKNAFMMAHSPLLQQAVQECRNDLAPILKHAHLYAQLKWRERRQKGEIPRLEAMLGNVKRLADIWAPVYVSDKVFEFLIRRVDL